MNKTYLYTRDSKGKIRVFIIEIESLDDVHTIKRQSGILNGKLTQQPDVVITKGKVNRTPLQQAVLEANSKINSQKDKGYKLLDKIDDNLSYIEIDKKLPMTKTDTSGGRKAMLAKDINDKTLEQKRAYFADKKYWFSRKLDGVRATIVKDGSEFKSVSRGGKDYDIVLQKIFRSKTLKKLFTLIPEGAVLDGEIYIHGRPLNYISGICRKGDWLEGVHDELEFWVFDYGSDIDDADTRCKLINDIAEKVKDNEDNIKVLNHVKLSGYDQMKLIHDIYVTEGYEGAIARLADAAYGWGGSKTDKMVKFKEFMDDEFEITGYKPGLRDEDMCFTCKTSDGKAFEAKPIGKAEVKIQYIKDIKSLIGKMLTVKFFGYTEYGIPNLPSGKCVRYEQDLPQK